MNIPDWYELLLLTLAGFRMWRLLSEDELLDWPRRRLLRLGDWQEEGDSVPANYRKTLGAFAGCAHCLGAWCALGWWVAWQGWPVAEKRRSCRSHRLLPPLGSRWWISSHLMTRFGCLVG